MIDTLYEQIARREELRPSLTELRARIKEEGSEQIRGLFAKRPEALLDCLLCEDPKVRKNAALILGELGEESAAEALWQAYEQETQLFVRSEYLKALGAYDCSPYLAALRERMKDLEEELAGQPEESRKKHLREELAALRKLLFQYEKPGEHAFTGLREPLELLLLTNKGCERMLEAQVRSAQEAAGVTDFTLRPVKGGVLAEGVQIEPLLSVRTWRELLLPLKGSRRMPGEQMAERLLETNLMELLERLHEGQPPYYFRIDCRSRMSLEERTDFCKAMAARLEQLSKGQLRNAPSAYELELRLTENKEGSFCPLLKLCTLPDRRFAYRKQTVAASMAPVQAAICMELAGPYLKEQAQVLDPFCGAGTMLLERNYRLHANTLYGVDLYGPAVEKARENARIAGVPAHFVNRDFRTFTHGHLFDEIVTNFPSKGKSLGAHDLDLLHGQFLEQAGRLLKPDGMILLYSHDRGYLKKHLRQHPEWKLMREWCISEKEGTYLFQIQPSGQEIPGDQEGSHSHCQREQGIKPGHGRAV